MMKKTKKALSVILSFLITASAFSLIPIRTHAASATGVYGGIAPSVMSSVVDDIEDNFNIDESSTEENGIEEIAVEENSWTPSVGTCVNTDDITVAPYSPYEGNASLLWTVGAVSANRKVTVSKGAAALTESSHYKYITATFYIPSEAKSASVTMRLIGSRGTVTDTKTIDAGKWQTVFFDTKETNVGIVRRVEFSFAVKKACDLYIFADSIGGCRSANDMRSARYMTASFDGVGCAVEYDRNITVTLSGEDPYIEAKKVLGADFGHGIGMRVNMINHTSCRSLTLKYKTALSVEYDKEITLDIPDSDREITLLFKIPEEKITAFTIYFGGANSGDVEIISIGPSPCFEDIPSIGSIWECRVARDLKNISVKGRVDFIPTDGRVMLYSLMANEDNSNIENLREPLAETKVKNGEFSFTVPLDRGNDGIFKKYIVAVNTENGLEVICEPSYVNNPELLATERTSLPESKKGIRPLPDNYVLYGIAQTALDIDLKELLSPEGKMLSHTVGSVTCSFSSQYLNSLDAKMKEYEREGIKVRFVFKNIAEIENEINTLRAVTDLLVRRYGSSGGKTDNLVGIVLGASVNDAHNNYDLGAVTLSEFAREYGMALRTVYNASVSVTSGFEVSAGVGGKWNFDLTVGQKGSFDARSTLEAVSDCITSGGDINWKLAYDITPENGEYAYNELSYDRGVGAERITAANLETLTEFFSLSPFLYNGASRSILLIGDEERKAASVTEEKSLTADYIYTFLRISERSMKNVSGYIPSHEADYEGALAYVGTDMFIEKSDFAASLIGKDRFDALTASGAVTDRDYLETEAGSALPTGIKGESIIFNLKNKNMLTPSLNCISAESGVSYGNRKDWGRIRLGEADGKALRGFFLSSPYPLDLSVAPYLSFNLIVSSLPEGVDTVKVTVALYSNKNIAVASTSVPVDGESKVVCDMSAFTHLTSCDRIGIYITGENGKSIGEPMILVSSVKAHSQTLSGEELHDAINVLAGEGDTVSVYTVINLVIVAIASITVLVLRIVLRNKRPKKSVDNE